jgi:hypothetical protein
MNNLSLRIYFLLCSLVTWFQAWAQDDEDEDDVIGGPKRGLEENPFEDFMDYQPLNFRISDILLVIGTLVACYVFGRIWKGCTYLILLVAVIFYFLAR